MELLKMFIFILIEIIACLIICESGVLKTVENIKRLESSTEKQIGNVGFKIKGRIWRSVGLGILLFIAGLINYNSIIFAFVLSTAGFLMPTGLAVMKRKILYRETMIDLFNIVECLKMQVSSQVPLKYAIRNIPEICQNKKVKKIMSELSMKYELDSFKIDGALDILKSKLNFPEIHVFSSAILQQSQGNDGKEAMESLEENLKEKNIEFLEENTNNKMLIMTLSLTIILFNLTIMASFPVITEIGASLNKIIG